MASLLRRLFGPAPPLPTADLDETICTELVAAVGEAQYQRALAGICGSVRWERVRHSCRAVLVLEPSNAYDPKVVAVLAGPKRQRVGYLSRGDARDYRPLLLQAAEQGLHVCCPAHIAGRSPGSETPNLGIFLDLPPADAEIDFASG